MGPEATGLGEAVVQHLCRPYTEHLILVNVGSAFYHSLPLIFDSFLTVAFNAYANSVRETFASECQDKLANPMSLVSSMLT